MFLDRRGFTLGEVLASLIALGIIALTVQSLILFANNFLNQQEGALSSLEEQVFLSNMLCMKFQRPVFAEYDPSRSFEYDPDDEKYEQKKVGRPNPKEDPAVFSVPLLDKSKGVNNEIELSVADHGAVNTFLKDKLTMATSHTDTSKVLRAHINDKVSDFSNFEVNPTGDLHNYYSQFYDIYADDHTLPTFMIRQNEDNLDLGKISDGFIYASRCIKNEVSASTAGSFIEIEGKNPKYSIIDSTDKDMSEEEIKATALYVLEQRWRPFYFPSGNKNKVICCDIDEYDGSTDVIKLDSSGNPPSNCETLKKYTPIVYVISISSGDLGTTVEESVFDNNSLAGYVQNEAEDYFSGHTDCDTDPPGKVDWDGNCKEHAKKKYLDKLGTKIVHPVTFTSIEELPLVKKDRVNTWAYGFVASTFSDPYYKEFKILSVENKCHSSMPVGFCGKAMPGKDLSATANLLQNGKSAADYLITKVRNCPFRYITMENSASPMPLGLDRME